MIPNAVRRVMTALAASLLALAAGTAQAGGAPGTGSGMGCDSSSNGLDNSCLVDLDFGWVPSGNYGKGFYGAAAKVSFANLSSQPVAIYHVYASWPAFFAYSGCPSVLDPWTSCEIGVYFAPPWPGNYEGELTVDAGWPIGSVRARLFGTGY